MEGGDFGNGFMKHGIDVWYGVCLDNKRDSIIERWYSITLREISDSIFL